MHDYFFPNNQSVTSVRISTTYFMPTPSQCFAVTYLEYTRSNDDGTKLLVDMFMFQFKKIKIWIHSIGFWNEEMLSSIFRLPFVHYSWLNTMYIHTCYVMLQKWTHGVFVNSCLAMKYFIMYCNPRYTHVSVWYTWFLWQWHMVLITRHTCMVSVAGIYL